MNADGAYWEDQEEPLHEPTDEYLGTKDPGDYKGGPCGVMALLIPFVIIGLVLTLPLRLFRRGEQNPDGEFGCGKDVLAMLALPLGLIAGFGLWLFN